MSYLIKWRETQRPNELDGTASTRSDTLPLGVTTDHIISSLPSAPDNSINGLIDWDLSQQDPALREKPGCSTDLCRD